MNTPHYTMLIQWSDEDQIFIVSLPEWEEQARLLGHTHGKTYAEAVQMGEELLELLIEGRVAEGKSLPVARVYATTP